jgi:hypothetical protein
VVVVVEVAGAADVCVVVVLVVLVVGGGVAQPVNDTSTAAMEHDRINFFISMIVVWFITLQSMIASSAGQRLWGVTLPCGEGCAEFRRWPLCLGGSKSSWGEHLMENVP